MCQGRLGSRISSVGVDGSLRHLVKSQQQTGSRKPGHEPKVNTTFKAPLNDPFLLVAPSSYWLQSTAARRDQVFSLCACGEHFAFKPLQCCPPRLKCFCVNQLLLSPSLTVVPSICDLAGQQLGLDATYLNLLQTAPHFCQAFMLSLQNNCANLHLIHQSLILQSASLGMWSWSQVLMNQAAACSSS